MSVLSGVPHCHARRGTFLPLQQNVPNCNSDLFARKTFSKFPHNCDFVQQHKINNFFTQCTAAHTRGTAAYTCGTAAYIVNCDFNENPKSDFHFDLGFVNKISIVIEGDHGIESII